MVGLQVQVGGLLVAQRARELGELLVAEWLRPVGLLAEVLGLT